MVDLFNINYTILFAIDTLYLISTLAHQTTYNANIPERYWGIIVPSMMFDV